MSKGLAFRGGALQLAADGLCSGVDYVHTRVQLWFHSNCVTVAPLGFTCNCFVRYHQLYACIPFEGWHLAVYLLLMTVARQARCLYSTAQY
jgi:hypothetical protein